MLNPIIVDSHLDIAWNRIALGRDFRDSVEAKRGREGPAPAHGEGSATVGMPEMLKANVRIAFATIYVAQAQPDRKTWGKTYSSPQEAHDQGIEQLEYYRELARVSQVKIIQDRSSLANTVASDSDIGLVILMEGADPIVTPAQVSEWFAAGVRIVGPAWSRTRYSGGTRAPGGLSPLGRALMPEMESIGMVLDASHMAEQSFFETLDIFHGKVIASHSNCRVYVDSDRQLTDEMIRAIISRDGVIGTVMFNGFLRQEYGRDSAKDTVTLEDAVRHIEHICSLAGNSLHAGIGSDLDGGFGSESVPKEIDSIADLPRLADALSRRFADADIVNILGGNWIRFLESALLK